jgi:tetratricopeptide (TPR) repeat protein
MMHKNFSGAISSFTEAIADDGNDVNSYFRRGQSFFCMGNYKEAIVDFDRALAKGAMDYNVYLWKGTANAKLNNVDLSILNYEKAMRLNPKLVDPFRVTDKTKDSSKAAESSDSSKAASTPDSSKATSTSDSSKAASTPDSSKATSTSDSFKAASTPDSSKTASTLDSSKAASTTDSSKTANTTDSSQLESRVEAVRSAVANVLSEQHGVRPEAGTSSPNTGSGGAETRNSTPEVKSATISLSGSSEKSVDAYKMAAHRIIENEKGYFRAGTTYSGLLNFSHQLIPLSGFNGQPDWVEGTHDGHAYFSLKDPKRDLRDLDAQIILHPQDATLFFQRARASQQLGKTKETIDDLNRAVELDSTNPNYFLARAFYFQQQNNLEAAVTEILRAQDVDPVVPSDLTFVVPVKNAAKSAPLESIPKKDGAKL